MEELHTFIYIIQLENEIILIGEAKVKVDINKILKSAGGTLLSRANINIMVMYNWSRILCFCFGKVCVYLI